jgi:hypothetical protein
VFRQNRRKHAGDIVTKSSDIEFVPPMRAACEAWEAQPEGSVEQASMR